MSAVIVAALDVAASHLQGGPCTVLLLCRLVFRALPRTTSRAGST